MMMISLIVPLVILAVFIGIITFIVGAREGVKTSNGSELKEGGEEMIKSLYIYLVLFATLMMTIGGSVSAFMAVADLVAPTPYYQSYEDFERWQIDGKGDYANRDENFVRPTDAEIQSKYDAMVTSEKQRVIGRAKNSLIKSFGWILIPLGIFIFFQRNLVKNKA